jgi:hypothetical protein
MTIARDIIPGVDAAAIITPQGRWNGALGDL